MKYLTDPSQPSYRRLCTIVDLYFLNMLFLLTCGFGLLVGPAAAALAAVNYEELQEHSGGVVKAYFKAYKENFKRGIGLELVLMLGGMLLLVCFRAAQIVGGVPTILAMAALIIFAIVYFFWLVMVFPYTARYDDTVRHTLKVCFQIAVMHLKSVLYLVLVALIIWLLGSMSQMAFTVEVIVMIMIGFSGLSYIDGWVMYPVFAKYEHQGAAVQG